MFYYMYDTYTYIIGVRTTFTDTCHFKSTFASFLIPAKLFSNEIITNQFSLGFMINTFPIALEPAVDSLTEYALNGICSVTGHCLANAMIE